MSLRYLEDVSLLSQNKPTGIEGVESIIRFVKDSTPEVNNLLKNECDVILECRYCRSMFRSMANFVSHKRTFCRGMHQVAIANVQAARKAIEEEVEKIEKESKEKEKEQPKREKNMTHLRRTNIVGALNKKATDVEVPVPGSKSMMLHTLPRVSKEVPVTVFENGMQKVVDIPPTLAQKEAVPDDRVVLVMPQDHSSKYREMQLRNRRDAANKQESTREVTSGDLSCLERCEAHAPTLPDAIALRCLHEDCASIRPFGSIQALMYHIGIKHIRRNSPDATSHPNKIPCLLCNWSIKTWNGYHNHYTKAHGWVKEEHDTFRTKDQETEKRRAGRKSLVRHRSLSPIISGVELDGKEEEEEHESEESSPPVITREEDDEPVNEDDDQKEEDMDEENPPRLVKMSRNRREVRVPRKYQQQSTDASPHRSGSAQKKTPPTSGEKKTPKSSESTPVLSREVSRERAPSAGSSIAARQELKEQRRSEKKRSSDVMRSLEFLISKTSSGQLNASLDELSSREPSFTPTPPPHLTEAISEPPVLEASFTSTASKVSPPSGASKKANISTELKKKRLEDLFPKTSTKTESDSDEALEAFKQKKKEMKKEPKSEAESSSEDDSSPVVRPSRNRKRPDWMVNDYILEGESEKGSVSKKARKEEDAVVSAPKIASAVPRRHSAGADVPSKDSTESPLSVKSEFAKRILHSSFTIPKKRKTQSNVFDKVEENKNSPSKRKDKSKPLVVGGPPRLVHCNDFVVPGQNASTSAASEPSSKLQPSITDSELPYTPRARRLLSLPDSKATVPTSPSNGRRKQNLEAAKDDDNDVRMLSRNGKAELFNGDLSAVPVFLSQSQKKLFFSSLISMPKSDSSTGGDLPYCCDHCKTELPNLKEGRRHMVSHIRVMRLRCSLCGAGAFFCTDMRAHLMEGCCDKLHLAPPNLVRPGLPKMTRENADRLTEIVDKGHPGRVMYTSGQIVSATSKVPYFPDPVIEERILGCNRVVGKSFAARTIQQFTP